MTDNQLDQLIAAHTLDLSATYATKLMRTRKDIIESNQDEQLTFIKSIVTETALLLETEIIPKLNKKYSGIKTDD